MTHHAIEQAVKDLDAIVEHTSRYSGCTCDTSDCHAGDCWPCRMHVIGNDVDDVATSLRALQQEPSTTDEELAHHLASELADTIEGVTCGDEIHRYLVPDKAIPLITQAFAAIRKQARDEAYSEAIKHFQDHYEKHSQEFSSMDSETGSYEFGNEAQQEYSHTLCDVIDDLNKLKDSK